MYLSNQFASFPSTTWLVLLINQQFFPSTSILFLATFFWLGSDRIFPPTTTYPIWLNGSTACNPNHRGGGSLQLISPSAIQAKRWERSSPDIGPFQLQHLCYPEWHWEIVQLSHFIWNHDWPISLNKIFQNLPKDTESISQPANINRTMIKTNRNCDL